jgi:hypothetical protein
MNGSVIQPPTVAASNSAEHPSGTNCARISTVRRL